MNGHADTALVWLRNDLRTHDNPALAYALRQHARVVCLYIDTTDWDDPPASAWWLRGALQDLSSQLGGRLLYLQGQEVAVLQKLQAEQGFSAVYWNRRYEPEPRERDALIKQWLKDQSIKVASFPGNLLFEPWEISKADGTPYRVFTPFYKAAIAKGLVPAFEAIPSGDLEKLSDVGPAAAEALQSLPVKPWMEGFADHWEPTRAAADKRLEGFVTTAMSAYDEGRNLPAQDYCSRLSPWLHHGQIGVREVAARVQGEPEAGPFVRELIWREFAHYIAYHWPQSIDEPMDRRFRHMSWRDDAAALRAWQQGMTGIPLVDAGMRELWQSGFMHNRVRMVVASLLTKHLLIDWRDGARWFEYTLLDADLQNNRMGWQWCAGSGVDAAPYFRIFNPVSQGERFDRAGDYVRRWVPELKHMPAKWLHRPWEAPQEVLSEAGVKLGVDYPWPIVELKAGRERALAAWDSVKAAAAG